MIDGSNKIYTANVIDVLENGDAILELPQDLLDEVGWKLGDTIYIDDRDNSIVLSKVINSNGENKTVQT